MKNIYSYLIITIITFLNINCLGTATETNKEYIYIFNKKNGFQVSDDYGSSWKSENSGLPENINPLKLINTKNYIYMTSYTHGIYRFNKVQNNWNNISSDDFRKRSIYSEKKEYRKISGFNVDNKNDKNIVISTKHDIYISTNSGETWNKINMRGLHKRNYITSVAIVGSKIYAGTAFNGVYELKNGKFHHSGKGLPGEPYSGTLRFTEQVSEINIVHNNIYIGFYFSNKIFYKKNKTRTFKKKSSYNYKEKIDDIKNIGGSIYISSNGKIFKDGREYDKINNTLKKINKNKNCQLILVPIHKDKKSYICSINNNYEIEKLNSSAKDRHSIYVSIPAIKKNLNKYLNLSKSTEINSFVIDMKDDFGNIYYKSSLDTVKNIGSQRRPVNIKKILNILKENKIYSIARIVVFKDKKMYHAFNGKYAIKNKKTGKPWKGTKFEYWVDPYSKFVHNYNINLAKELEQLGFDEIQFDYIRFPSDGPINLCNYSYSKDKETYKSEILIDFLSESKRKLDIPVSVDIYGFNSWYNFGNWIGQDIDELSTVVDAICPMVYPSHFGNSFYKKGKRSLRSYRIVYDGAIRSQKLIRNKIILRPYLQAFNLLSPTWGPEYILNQINAAKNGGCSGYTLWNARGDYKTPEKALLIKR